MAGYMISLPRDGIQRSAEQIERAVEREIDRLDGVFMATGSAMT